jgi:NAD(P)-dependent dehydrogenase (short-subunit alcohol dehydrogenase family)
MVTTPFTGRVAVVTGSNKGIGYFIALQLGLSGLFQHVLLGCRDASLAASAVERLKAEFASNTNNLTSATCTATGQPVSVSSYPLTLGDQGSHQEFARHVQDTFGMCHLLVNNAAFAYKGADPTPFQEQCKPTLDVNFRGTVDFTERMLPLLRQAGQQAGDARIVNVASMSGVLRQVTNPTKVEKLSSPDLTMPELMELVDDFQARVLTGTHKEAGWGNSNYGMSKLAVIAATKVWAREELGSNVSVNACCPGYCKTDMTSQNGRRDPADGAKNAVIPATMENPPTGEFFQDYKISPW